MHFLFTERGDMIAASAIVRIGPLNTRPTRQWHDIEYCVGSDPRETTATEDAVNEFLYGEEE